MDQKIEVIKPKRPQKKNKAPVKKTPAKKKKKSPTKKEKTAFDLLSPAHKLFVLKYIETCFHGTKSYMAAYPRASYDTARNNAAGLLAKTSIKKALEEKQKELFTGIQTDIQKSKTYRLIEAISETRISNIVNWEGDTLYVKNLDEISPEAEMAIDSVKYSDKDTANGTDKQIEIKLVSKAKMLEMRAKIQGLLDSKENQAPIEITIIPPEKPE